MKIILDTDACKGNGRDPDVLFYLLSLLSGYPITPSTFEKARQSGFLKFDRPYDPRNLFPDYVSLSQTGEFVTESVMAKSNVPANSENRFMALAEQMRALFPAGNKIGQNGSKYPWRSNATTVADRLEKFVAKYGDHTDEEFIDATKRYLADYMGKPDMRILMYFVYKNVEGEKKVVDGRMVGDRDRISPLADYLANKEEDAVPIDWEIELR